MVRHVLALFVVLDVVAPLTAAAKGPPPVAAPAAGSGVIKSIKRLAPPLGCDRLTIAEGLPNSNVRAMAQDRRGFMWLGTQDGLARYDGITMRVYRSIDKDPSSISTGYITSIVLDASGKLWVGTDSRGVNLYDPDTDKFTRFEKGKDAGSLTADGIAAIARDKKDRIWLAMSTGGLDRYEPDSKSFTRYNAKPLDVTITAISADAAGNLWLGTANEGVIKWNPETNQSTSYLASDDRAAGATPITAILAASSGTIWIGTEGDGLVALDPATGKLSSRRYNAEDPGTLSDDHVSSLFEDHDKTLWIGTTDGLNRLEPSGRLVRYQHDPNNPTSLSFHGVESIFQDAGGVMWVGGFTVGICKFDQLRLNFGHYHAANLVTSFFEDPDGTLWVGTYNDGLYKYKRNEQRVTNYRDLGQLPLDLSSWIAALHRDRRGTLWISLRGKGLAAFDTSTETYKLYVPEPNKPNSLPIDTVWAIAEDEQGRLWLATWGAGIVRFDPRTEVFTAFTADAADDSTGLSSNHIYTLHPDPTDKTILWAGTAKGGLVKFNTVSGTATSFKHKADDPASLASDDVLAIWRDPAGSVWCGTYGGGLNRVDPATGKVEHFTTSNSGLTNNVILGLLPDTEGKIWLATNGGGLVQFDPKTKKFLVYDSSDGVQDNEFDQGSFMRSKSGELFFGGPGGFNAFRAKDIRRDPYVPPVVMTAFKVFNQDVTLDRPIWTLPRVDVSYSDSFEVQFAALSFAGPKRNRYAYKLEGFDDKFIETDRPFATYTKLGGGNYTLRVRGSNRDGVWNEAGIALELGVTPPWWRTWRAYGVYLLALAGAVLLLYRIQRERLRRAEREGRLAVVERDLELTGAVQTGFLPEHNEINTAGLKLVGIYRPADACGGDWWWHEPLPDGRHVVMVGDVSGHGPGPAMVTAAVATAFRVLLENGLQNLEQGLELLNREVLRVGKGQYHMTMAALELDESTGRWVCHSAGAPPLLSLGPTGKHKVHFCAGAPLGTYAGFETGRVEGKLEPADRLLIYTDGIPEVALPNGNVMGLRRFAQQFEITRGQDIKTAAASIVMHADHTRANQPQTDDWTFTLIERGQHWS